jgi:hypothetical protein
VRQRSAAGFAAPTTKLNARRVCIWRKKLAVLMLASAIVPRGGSDGEEGAQENWQEIHDKEEKGGG